MPTESPVWARNPNDYQRLPAATEGDVRTVLLVLTAKADFYSLVYRLSAMSMKVPLLPSRALEVHIAGQFVSLAPLAAHFSPALQIAAYLAMQARQAVVSLNELLFSSFCHGSVFDGVIVAEPDSISRCSA